jgi:hypothetical protein
MQMKFSFEIRVHCWGGLGSQLYAWALFEDLKFKFQHRRIVLVLHDNGVTRRKSEISKFFTIAETRQILDFVEPRIVKNNTINYLPLKFNWSKRFIKKFVKMLLKKTGLVSYCDTNDDFKKIKPWVLSVRGNYYQRIISDNALMQIHSKFQANGFLINGQSKESCIHYRLGDLLTLTEKQPNEPSRVFQALKILYSHTQIETLHIFSDSPELALENLSRYIDASQIKTHSEEILEVFSRLIEAENFIGTSSKISEWVLIFRLHLHMNGLTIVTKEIMDHVNKNFNKRLAVENILTY